MLKKILARFKGLFSRKPVCVCVCNQSPSNVLVEQAAGQDGLRKLVISILSDELAKPSSSTGRIMRKVWSKKARS